MREKLLQQHTELSARYDRLVQDKSKAEAKLDAVKRKIQETLQDLEKVEKALYPSTFTTEY